MPVGRFFRRFSASSDNHASEASNQNRREYVEFDRLDDIDDVGSYQSPNIYTTDNNDTSNNNNQQINANKDRLNSIWRNENNHNKRESITTHVQKQEFDSDIDSKQIKIHQNTQSHAARTLPKIMHEHVINTRNQFNKVFASSFLSENIVTFGTKDNKLMLLDVVKGKICQIRLPNPEKSFDYNKKLDSNNSNNKHSDKDNQQSCGIHDLKYNINNNLLITGGYNANDIALFKYDNDIHHIGPKKFSHNLVPLATLKFHNDWVFAMDWLDSENIVAGGRDGQLSIWNLSNIDSTYNSFREKFGLKKWNDSNVPFELNHYSNETGGHGNNTYEEECRDFLGLGIGLESSSPDGRGNSRVNQSLFAQSAPELQQSLLGNIDDNGNDMEPYVRGNGRSINNDSDLDMQHIRHLQSKKNVSLSQDRCNVPILRNPVHFTTDKKHRIRALKAFSNSTSMRHSQSVVSLATTGQIQIYDVSKRKSIFSEYLPHRKETVCIEINSDKGQIIVGSQSHIQIFDPRTIMSDSLQVIDSLDKNWGCRTISAHTDLLTIGGGLGRLSFYDLRKNEYIDCGTKLKHDKINGGLSDQAIQYRTIDKGWIKQDDVYNNIFVVHGLPTPSAIYTHCYNQNRSKLFAAGGPTPYGLFGSAASVYF